MNATLNAARYKDNYTVSVQRLQPTLFLNAVRRHFQVLSKLAANYRHFAPQHPAQDASIARERITFNSPRNNFVPACTVASWAHTQGVTDLDDRTHNLLSVLQFF